MHTVTALNRSKIKSSYPGLEEMALANGEAVGQSPSTALRIGEYGRSHLAREGVESTASNVLVRRFDGLLYGIQVSPGSPEP